MEIQRENRTTLLFISHDLSLVRYLADRVVVMYLGTIAEQGTTDEVFAPPYHPYTEALLSAIPIADTSVAKKHIVLEGDIPSAVNPPPGCPFQTRCPRKLGAICEQRGAAGPRVRARPQDRLPHRARGARAHGAGDRHGRQGRGGIAFRQLVAASPGRVRWVRIRLHRSAARRPQTGARRVAAIGPTARDTATSDRRAR